MPTLPRIESLDIYVKSKVDETTRSRCGGVLTLLLPVLLVAYLLFRLISISQGAMLSESTSIRIFPSSFKGREMHLPELECIAESGCYYVPMQQEGVPRCCRYLAKGERMPKDYRRIYAAPDPTETFTVVWVAPDSVGSGGEYNFGMSYRESAVVDPHTWSLDVVEPGDFNFPASKKLHRGTSFWSLVETNKTNPWKLQDGTKINHLWTTTVVSEESISLSSHMCCGLGPDTAGSRCNKPENKVSVETGSGGGGGGAPPPPDGGGGGGGVPPPPPGGDGGGGGGGGHPPPPGGGGSGSGGGGVPPPSSGGGGGGMPPPPGGGVPPPPSGGGGGGSPPPGDGGTQPPPPPPRRLSGACEIGGVSGKRVVGARLLPFPTYTAVDIKDMGPFSLLAEIGGIKGILDTIAGVAVGFWLFASSKRGGGNKSSDDVPLQKIVPCEGNESASSR
eukprot:TRINITY_DN29096_c1_g1_i1.p1 TRINITY_DN29096_c1_g1~~TRINITY_DN29096_c1_g1_i1.p1  ORF type:complete len:447 (+),score=60.79 TRINITY_DN29096_c1_g1_i1:98-1438(+)